MLNHLPFAKIADLAEGHLSPDERAASESHLAACGRCAAKLSRLESVIGLIRTDDAEDAPAGLVSSAVNLFRARSASQRPSLSRRLMATLSFDSLQMSPAYGVRSGQQAGARQLIYNAGECDLDLRVARSGEAWAVSGQVLGRECAGGRVELEGESREARTDLNAQCEFTIPAVPSGSYRLRLCLRDLEVEIPQLELRA
ncbi:MAG TPA: hypothetical protein VF723_11100 [Pyrinomonadaceae bacterium]|jgi:anti-sigma factor RsiW